MFGPTFKINITQQMFLKLKVRKKLILLMLKMCQTVKLTSLRKNQNVPQENKFQHLRASKDSNDY
jgi:hypothetical protein